MEDLNSIKRTLSNLKSNRNKFSYRVGYYQIIFYTVGQSSGNYDDLCTYNEFDYYLYDIVRNQTDFSNLILMNPINPESDNRFSFLNLNLNKTLSLIELCKLIKHLHKLSGLNAFS